MNKETITDKQGISILVLFLCGSTLIFDTGTGAKEDIWLAIIIAFLCAFVMAMLYARVLSIFPGKDIFDILIIAFGTVIGRVLCLFYVFFSIHLASLVLYNFEEFITIAALSDTPALVPLVTTMLLIIWIIKSGIKVLGNWSEFFVVILVVLVFLTLPFFIPIAKIENLKPFLYNGIQPVLDGALLSFTFPFTEIVVFLGVGAALKNKKSPYKVYALGLAFGALIIFSSAVMHMMVLGGENMGRTFFPPYRSYKLINIREFFTRIEIVIGAALIIGGFVKISVCLFSACRGLCKVFAIDNYKVIATPICILATIISTTNFTGVLELVEWDNTVWIWYSLFFEVVLFLFVLIGVEIKVRIRKRS